MIKIKEIGSRAVCFLRSWCGSIPCVLSCDSNCVCVQVENFNKLCPLEISSLWCYLCFET